MLRAKDFWIGLLVGVAVFYLYQNHFKKGPGA